MKIDQFKVMLELQALQGLNSINTTSSASTLFQDFLSNMLTSEESLTNSIETNTLGTSSLSLGLTNNVSLLPMSLTKLSSSSTSTSDFDEMIKTAAEKYNLPEKLISSVIKVESNFNPNATSYAGASGLMQLMPSTAKSLGVENVFNPLDNIMGGSKYLKQMLEKYDGNVELALAAYNAGPGNVDKYGGIPPFKETQNYVNKVTQHYMA
ncbi:lytic transglycosylase domain-containing protein [Niallia sp.]|uniref:lytic transglycosylase domain-containing protein n=1 Tax=Niallia sp. TaxID=2837523 RepID=UPI002897AEA4|nr:lytic transglycosylase domain-containing protein [Niallia sp.]